MNKQTAVEWFASRISHGGLVSMKQFNELLEQAKEMEKEQKIAFANQFAEAVMGGCLLTPTEFYNETFKSE